MRFALAIMPMVAFGDEAALILTVEVLDQTWREA